MKENYIYPLVGAVGVLIVEGKIILNKLSTLKNLRDTRTDDIDLILTKSEDDYFECIGRPITQFISPITDTPCAWWSFTVSQVKSSGNNSMGSFPVLVTTADFSWLLLETPKNILALSLKNLEVIESINTFTWTGILNTNPPSRLKRYLDSKEFLELIGVETNYLAYIPSLATSYLESVVFANSAFHVHGQIKSLDEIEKNLIEERLKSLKITKELIPLTITGPHYRIGEDETETVKKIKFELWIHCYLCVFAIFVLVASLYNFNID